MGFNHQSKCPLLRPYLRHRLWVLLIWRSNLVCNLGCIYLIFFKLYINRCFFIFYEVFSERDDSISKRLQDSMRQSKNLIEEQRSLSFNRFKQRIDDITITKSASTGKEYSIFV